MANGPDGIRPDRNSSSLNEKTDMDTARDSAIQMLDQIRTSPRIVLSLGSALVAVVILTLMDAGLWFSLALPLLVAAGVWLLIKDPTPEPPLPEVLAFAQAKTGLSAMQASIGDIPRASMRKCVTKLTDEIERMLDAIEKDQHRGSMMVAPVYTSQLVDPFANLLEKTLWLHERGVKQADVYIERIETTVCPKTLDAAEEFYQQYHQQDVLDLAALSEILEHLLDTISDASANGFDDDSAD
jgi:hypothetical protein